MRRFPQSFGVLVAALAPPAALLVVRARRITALQAEVARLTEAAHAAEREKDEFLATLSHELRTPLNAILGWVKLLRLDIDNPVERRHALDVIERNARRQASVVGDLLDMSRIVTGKLQLAREVVALDTVTRDAVAAVYDAATAKRLTVLVDAAAGVQVCGDAERLRQVVTHLLDNAVKFTPAGGTINVRVHRDGGKAIVEVADTGIGFDADALPRLFQSFCQAESGPTRHYGGLGLGLTLVRTLVERHGGTVEVASPGPGAGATFTVRLPAVRAGAGFAA